MVCKSTPWSINHVCVCVSRPAMSRVHSRHEPGRSLSSSTPGHPGMRVRPGTRPSLINGKGGAVSLLPNPLLRMESLKLAPWCPVSSSNKVWSTENIPASHYVQWIEQNDRSVAEMVWLYVLTVKTVYHLGISWHVQPGMLIWYHFSGFFRAIKSWQCQNL